MRKDITGKSHLKLLPALATTNESESAYSHFGHVSHASTPSQDLLTARANRLQRLSELLNYLENQVEILSLRLAEACDTLNTDIETQLVEHYNSITEKGGIDDN